MISYHGKWKICQTNCPHPTITSGQHNNGPAGLWVEIDGEWVHANTTHLYRLVRELDTNGVDRIEAGIWDGRGQ